MTLAGERQRPLFHGKHHHMVYGWIPNAAYAEFDRIAAARGEHVDVLVARILTVIASDSLLGAILDERDGD